MARDLHFSRVAVSGLFRGRRSDDLLEKQGLRVVRGCRNGQRPPTRLAASEHVHEAGRWRPDNPLGPVASPPKLVWHFPPRSPISPRPPIPREENPCANFAPSLPSCCSPPLPLHSRRSRSRTPRSTP